MNGKLKPGVLILSLILYPFAFLSFAGEIDELRKELVAVQARISEEEARYQAAKAAMERSAVVAQYLFPELRLREKQLTEKIDMLVAAESKATAQSQEKK